MRRFLVITTFLLNYPLAVEAMPARCPKIDSAMLKADASLLTKGGELMLNGYQWKVTGGNLCDPNCGDRYHQALMPGVTTHATLTTQGDHVSCTYNFNSNDKVIADLVLTTDESMKLPAHSFKRWEDVPENPEEVMEKEEEKYRDDPRVRME